MLNSRMFAKGQSHVMRLGVLCLLTAFLDFLLGADIRDQGIQSSQFLVLLICHSLQLAEAYA